MFGFSYRVLLLVISLFSSTALPQPLIQPCDNLFSSILKQEPYLQTELNDLKRMCEQDVKQKNAAYWSCVDQRMNQGPITFERLVLSSHVCGNSSESISARN
ncbi:MAG: hypothetical protein JXR04_03560 [Bermanella sp.]